MRWKKPLIDGLQIKTHEKDNQDRLSTTRNNLAKSKPRKGGWTDNSFLLSGIKNINANQFIRVS